MNFQKDYILENRRTRLEPLIADHFDTLLEYSTNEPELWKHSLQPASGSDNLLKYITTAINNREKEDSYAFIVYDKLKERYAGSTRFYDYQPRHNTVQLGFTWYGKEFQGTGLNKNCKYLLLEFAFETLGLHRVEFRADATNARSIAAMKSIGCTVEGILRSNCKSLAGRRDSIVLSILKDEWENELKHQLLKKIRLYSKI